MRKPGKGWMIIYYLVVKVYDKYIIMYVDTCFRCSPCSSETSCKLFFIIVTVNKVG